MELTLEEMVDLLFEFMGCTVAILLIVAFKHMDIFLTIVEKVM